MTTGDATAAARGGAACTTGAAGTAAALVLAGATGCAGLVAVLVADLSGQAGKGTDELQAVSRSAGVSTQASFFRRMVRVTGGRVITVFFLGYGPGLCCLARRCTDASPALYLISGAGPQHAVAAVQNKKALIHKEYRAFRGVQDWSDSSELIFGGAGGIRTRGGLLTHTRFPGVRLKPLIHRSVC